MRGPVPVFLASGRVLSIEPDVIVGQVAGPERAPTRTQREAEPERDVAIGLEIRRRQGFIEGLRRPRAVEKRIAQPERELLLVERHSRVTRRGDDATPV